MFPTIVTLYGEKIERMIEVIAGLRAIAANDGEEDIVAVFKSLVEDSELVDELGAVLIKYCGETGVSEGAVETLERIIAERDALQMSNKVLRAQKATSDMNLDILKKRAANAEEQLRSTQQEHLHTAEKLFDVCEQNEQLEEIGAVVYRALNNSVKETIDLEAEIESVHEYYQEKIEQSEELSTRLLDAIVMVQIMVGNDEEGTGPDFARLYRRVASAVMNRTRYTVGVDMGAGDSAGFHPDAAYYESVKNDTREHFSKLLERWPV